MTVAWLKSETPANKFAPTLKFPFYTAAEGSNEFIDNLTLQILEFEKQISKEDLVSEVPANLTDPYPYTRHWKQHNLFWDANALGGDQLDRFPMSSELEKLFHIIRKNYLLFLKEMGYSRIKCYVHAWANVLRKEQWISRHFHMADYTAYVSATYYLTTSPTSLFLFNPIRPDQAESLPNKKGNMIMFPSWVPHESSVYKGDDTRISLAFDIVMEDNLKSNPWRPHVLLDDPETMEGFDMYLKNRELTA